MQDAESNWRLAARSGSGGAPLNPQEACSRRPTPTPDDRKWLLRGCRGSDWHGPLLGPLRCCWNHGDGRSSNVRRQRGWVRTRHHGRKRGGLGLGSQSGSDRTYHPHVLFLIRRGVLHQTGFDASIGVLIHRKIEGGGRRSGTGGGKGPWGEPHVVGDQPESVVDLNPAKEGLKCTGEPVDTPFHGIHPLAGASGLFGDLVQFLHLVL